jgi:hypothetical protein
VLESRGEARRSSLDARTNDAECRCERFDVVKPLAAARESFAEALCLRGERRCKRFDVVKPLAAARESFAETLCLRGERRCKRFDVAERLAPVPEALREVRERFGEALSVRGVCSSIRRRAARQPGLDLDHLRVGHTVRDGGR